MAEFLIPERATRLHIERQWMMMLVGPRFIGPLMLRSGGHCLIVGLEGSFQIRVHTGPLFKARCCLVPAGVTHMVISDYTGLARFYVDGGRDELHALQKRFAIQPGVNIQDGLIFNDASMVNQARRLLNASAIDLNSCLPRINQASLCCPSRVHIDPRIQSVLRALWSNQKVEEDELYFAGFVCLSASRFRHLFRDEVGVSFTYYRRWRNLLAGLHHFMKFKDLTKAALAVGFYDLSHYSNHFKRTFGFAPSLLLAGLKENAMGQGG